MDNSNFAFFSFNDDFDEKNYEQSINKYYASKINVEYGEYILAEKDLEAMVSEQVIDFLIDADGTFWYRPTEIAMNAMNTLNLKPKECTFGEMLSRRGLNIDKYNRYKSLVRRLSR
jgi:hypothetical protein